MFWKSLSICFCNTYVCWQCIKGPNVVRSLQKKDLNYIEMHIAFQSNSQPLCAHSFFASVNNFERVVASRAYTTRIVYLNDKYSVARRVGSDLHTYLLTNYLKYHLDGFEPKIKICSQPSLLATLYEKTRGDKEKSLTALYYGLIT